MPDENVDDVRVGAPAAGGPRPGAAGARGQHPVAHGCPGGRGASGPVGAASAKPNGGQTNQTRRSAWRPLNRGIPTTTVVRFALRTCVVKICAGRSLAMSSPFARAGWAAACPPHAGAGSGAARTTAGVSGRRLQSTDQSGTITNVPDPPQAIHLVHRVK